MKLKSTDEISSDIINFAKTNNAHLTTGEAHKIATLSRVGWQLKTTSDQRILSKMGGNPWLPKSFKWPMRSANPQGIETMDQNIARFAQPGSMSWATPEQIETFRQEALAMKELFSAPYPLHFLAQIDFSAITLPDDETTARLLPTSGMLYLFYDMYDQPWGF
ncbi:MAG: DUF1963 domain-containing protein [Ahrensia sp.]|nr:DUF1963 domain-containing protein [Ahrensia sp.]